MNKVYFFDDGVGDSGGVYVAASTWKEARTIALCSSIIDYLDNPFIDIQGRMHKVNGKPLKTKLYGELDIKQLNEIGLAWWWCNSCDSEKFEILDDKKYKCIECGREDLIPYANM